MLTAQNFDDFCSFVEKKYQSKDTQRAYINDVKEFLKCVKSFDEESINRYIVMLSERGLSNRSIRRKLSSISVYFMFLKQRNIIENNPMEGIIKPKIEKNLPSFLDIEDVEMLLNKIEKARDRALIEIVYSSALRASEAMNLNIEDVDFNNLRIRIMRKGAKPSFVPMTKRAADAVYKYIGQRRKGAVFLNKYGKRLSTRSLQKIVKKYSLNTIFKDISPHSLRHSKATHLLNNGMDIRILQRFLGHSSIKATQIYTHLNMAELARVYDESHPLAKSDDKKEQK